MAKKKTTEKSDGVALVLERLYTMEQNMLQGFAGVAEKFREQYQITESVAEDIRVLKADTSTLKTEARELKAGLMEVRAELRDLRSLISMVSTNTEKVTDGLERQTDLAAIRLVLERHQERLQKLEVRNDAA
jgi:septal ring factor EnvC (AmiA/AmiB activator)